MCFHMLGLPLSLGHGLLLLFGFLAHRTPTNFDHASQLQGALPSAAALLVVPFSLSSPDVQQSRLLTYFLSSLFLSSSLTRGGPFFVGWPGFRKFICSAVFQQCIISCAILAHIGDIFRHERNGSSGPRACIRALPVTFLSCKSKSVRGVTAHA